VPNLSDHDLLQMDEDWQSRLPESVVRAVLARALDDLRQARDRLNQNPTNSSRPSGSMAPWTGKSGSQSDREGEDTAPAQTSEDGVHGSDDEDAPPDSRKAETGEDEPQGTTLRARSGPGKLAPGRPGKRRGAQGFGRTQKLAHTHIEQHYPGQCAACGAILTTDREAKAWHGWDSVELVSLAAAPGWQLQVTRHLLMQQSCACQHVTRKQAHRVCMDPLWGKVALGEQRLLGPRLAASLVYLNQRMRLSRRRVQELMQEFWGLELSIGLIDQTIQQAARAVEPLEDSLTEELHQAAIVHVDETSWKEAGLNLWLWVFVSSCTAYMVIGSRAAEMFENVMRQNFAGFLMSDGYGVYRSRENRLRCWAHLLRKAKGLAESTHQAAQKHGTQCMEHLQTLKRAIYAARSADPPPREQPVLLEAQTLQTLHRLCESLREHGHEPLRAFAREMLLDWEVIMRPLSQPHLPLTNNEAERALRHHVISRRISHGTRTPEGSRGYALLASVIETCRLRFASPIDMLSGTIHAARNGLPLPPLPPIPVA
jgi:transposase